MHLVNQVHIQLTEKGLKETEIHRLSGKRTILLDHFECSISKGVKKVRTLQTAVSKAWKILQNHFNFFKSTQGIFVKFWVSSMST